MNKPQTSFPHGVGVALDQSPLDDAKAVPPSATLTNMLNSNDNSGTDGSDSNTALQPTSDPDYLEDIHVRKLVDNFQNSVATAAPGGGRAPVPEAAPSIGGKSKRPLSSRGEESNSVQPVMSSPKKSNLPVSPSPSPDSPGVAEQAAELVLSPVDVLRRLGKSPEKPARRSREKSTERTLTAGGDSGSNVMSIVTRLNALAL
jgi:hypothetical protein